MNTFEAIDAEYLRSSRTIELVLASNGDRNKLFYVYNYEGYHFRVFKSILGLIGFFENRNEPDYDFDSDEELDDFLAKVDI